MANCLTFDEAKHEYRIAGRIVPSVTQVIRAVIPRKFDADEYYLERGAALHLACRYYDEKRLDESSVDHAIAGRLAAWKRFRVDFPAKMVGCELPMGHDDLQFAGTVDRVFEDQGQYVIADIKSSIEPAAEIQLGGYWALWRQRSPRVLKARAVAVKLNDDGTYRANWMSRGQLAESSAMFMHALSLYGWMAHNNLLKERQNVND